MSHVTPSANSDDCAENIAAASPIATTPETTDILVVICDASQTPVCIRRRRCYHASRCLRGAAAGVPVGFVSFRAPRFAERLCDGARSHPGGRRRRRQHDGSALKPVELRRTVAAEAAGRRHEYHDGADQNTAIYFNDSTLEEVQVTTSGNDAEVSVPDLDGRDHEIGGQYLSRRVSGLPGHLA